MNLIPDSKLTEKVDIQARIRSIDNQIEKMDSIMNPKDFNKHHKKYCSLVSRREMLCYRIYNPIGVHTIMK